jgi:serine/threonine-protein kinase
MSRELAGKTAGGFRLGDILAKGGSSTVYAAQQTEGGQQAAVKVFTQELPRDKNAAAKVIADVTQATALKHRNLVPVLEVGAVEHKGKRYLFIAMERLHGESLKARLSGQRQPMPLHVVLQIASEVGGALQAIARAGGAHRLLSPGSVFLVPPSDDERRDEPEAEDHVYLLDLGAALLPLETAKDGKDGKDNGKAARSAKEPAKETAKERDDLRGLAQLVQDMLGGLPTSVAAGRNAVLPVRWQNRQVPARIDAILQQVLSDGASSARSSRIDSVATLVAELLGVGDNLPSLHAWSEDGRAAMARPARSWSLWWAAGLALAGGAAVGYFMYTQEPLPLPPAAPDLAQAPVPAADLGSGGSLDLAVGGSALAHAPAAVDAGSADLPPRTWPKRTGPKIPPLRTLDPAGTTAATPAPAKPAYGSATAGAASPPAAKTATTGSQPTASPGTSPSPAKTPQAQEVK